MGLAVLFACASGARNAPSTSSRTRCGSSRATAGSAARIGFEGKPEALGQLGSAVNKLLENLEQRGARLLDREQLFQRLVETVHDAVLVHRERILFANSRFLALLNLSAAEVVGRALGRLRRAGICRVGARTICGGGCWANPPPSATRSNWSARRAK